MSNEFDPRCHIGETHGIYTLVDVLDEKDKYGHYIYKGVCNECGYEKFTHYGAFSGKSHIAIKCNHVGANDEYIVRANWTNRRIGNIFKGMKSRCYNENDDDYKNYGAKGIGICDEWLNDPLEFEKWSLNNGYSNDLTIDRMDWDDNYCPENCRWVTLEDNSRYKSTTSLIEVDNEVHTGKEWSSVLGFGANTINKYIREHGVENVIEFIHRFKNDPTLKPRHKQSYYDLYMNDNIVDA